MKRTNQFAALLEVVVPMLLWAGMGSAQASPDSSVLTVNGSAKLLTGPTGAAVIWLTPAQENQAGTAFLTNRVVFDARYRFSTFFQFKMTDPGPGGASDGMTFVLQTESATALGSYGGNLGYTGITPSVAVEFDTWQNAGDISDNHVGILTGGQITGLDQQTPYDVTNCQPTGAFGCMSNGDLWSVWIDYDGTNLQVALADNSTVRPANLISYPINLFSILGERAAFVGFTAGTGLGYQNHYVLNWQMIP